MSSGVCQPRMKDARIPAVARIAGFGAHFPQSFPLKTVTDVLTVKVHWPHHSPVTLAKWQHLHARLHAEQPGCGTDAAGWGNQHFRHGHRADASQPNMGLTSWEKAPDGKILKTDVVVAKNYLSTEELESLGRIVNSYLDLAEERARRKIPMTMEDWAKRLDAFLEFTDRDILQTAGKVSADMAKMHAQSEFGKYRIVQDRVFESDFDRAIRGIEGKGRPGNGDR